MKKIQLFAFLLFLQLAIFNQSKAQGWNHDRPGIFSVGVGGTQVIGIGFRYPAVYGVGMSLNFAGEFRVHRFVGIGFQTGIDMLVGPPYRENPRYAAIGIPIGFKVNVHILDAANVAVANRMDAYAGFNIGGGPAFFTSPAGGAYAFMYVGPQFGYRYWFNSSLGMFVEIGWGATFANFGLSF